VVHDGTFASLRKSDHVLDVKLDRALELLKKKKNKKSRKNNVIKELGDHPENGKKVRVMTGRYGPYIKYGKTNISLPDDFDPEDVNMDIAVQLITEKGK
jgi:DNA topoisomerase-1